MSIEERIKMLRVANGMSTYALAKEIGILQSSMSKIENGRRKLSAKEAVSIAKVLRIDVLEILTEKEGDTLVSS